MASKDVGLGKEFPTEWHREKYIENLQRELAGAKVRGYDDQVENARAELKRMGVKADPSVAVAPEVDDDSDTDDEVKTTKAARELAEQAGLDISEIEGTGRAGRVTVGDVEAAAGLKAAELSPADKAGKAK